MGDKINYYTEVGEEVSVKETVTTRVSTRRTSKQVLHDSSHYSSESDISSFLSEDEKSYVTSTPHISAEHGISDNGSSDKNLRVRRKACHRVHYSSDDLDESKHYCFEEKKKRSKKRRMSLLQSISTKQMDSEQVHVDTLENHLFPDMSFTESEMTYEDCFNTSSKTDVSWSKLQGVSYSSKYDFSGDELDVNCVINHPNRSYYRQKRREWYLNRRNRLRNTVVTSHKRWWRRYITQLIHIIMFITSLTYAVTSTTTSYIKIACMGVVTCLSMIIKVALLPIIYLVKLILYILVSVKNTIVSIFTKFACLFVSKSVKEVVGSEETITSTTTHKRSKKSCLYIFFWLLFVAVLFSAILLGFNEKSNIEEIIAPIPNPHKSGISNAYPIYIASENVKIPAWHIYPNLPSPSVTHPKKHTLSDKSPVVLYLRQEGSVDAAKLKNLYQTLSSLGYHIVVPTNILSQHDVLKTWKWIKAQSNATAYLWGYDMNAEALTVTAKLFCKNLIPPNGVLIAKEIKNSNLQQSMEIWSCNCALSADGDTNASDFKYNHVKCPIAFNNDVNDVYSKVVACIETVNRKDVT